MKKDHISMVCSLVLILAGVLPAMAAPAGIQTGRNTLVIDPGHGGNDPGIVSLFGLSEKQLTLALSRRIAEAAREINMTVILTRSEDISMTPRERTAQANINQADLFLSLHASDRSSLQESLQIFYFQEPESPDRQAAGTPAFHLRQDNRLDAAATSLRAAETSQKAATLFCGLHAGSAGARTGSCPTGAPVVVLSKAAMPALLIEAFSMAQITGNSDDTDRLIDRCSALILEGARLFFDSNQGVAE